MKITVLPALVLLSSAAAFAQTPAPAQIPSDVKNDIQIDIQSPIKTESAVAVADEPHHAHVFQNSYVRVYDVTVPPLDATLLHRHDLPYIYLMLGAADIVNEVEGKPAARLVLEDGAARYSPGDFTHLVRTDAGIPFHNITVALVHPQASLHNLGDKGDDRLLGSCPQNSAAPAQNDQIPFEQALPCFETSEVHMDEVKVQGGKDFLQASPETAALLIAMSNANLDVSLGGQHAAFLHVGDVLWLPTGLARKVGDFLGSGSRFLLISFKDSGAAPSK
ncbi:MAG: hypothetical protein WA789_00520 [Candidatus Acidiferrum sp.]